MDDHFAELRPDGWTLVHPVRCADLTQCEITAWMRRQTAPPGLGRRYLHRTGGDIEVGATVPPHELGTARRITGFYASPGWPS